MTHTTHTQTALITGGAKRIGRAMALHLAAAGWNIALHYRNSDAEASEVQTEIQAAGGTCELFCANLENATQTAQLIPTIHEAMGPISLLINNASLFVNDNLHDFSVEQYEAHMAVHCRAPLQLIRDFQAQISEYKGLIINMLDGMKQASLCDAFLTYTLSKETLAHMTQLLAVELAPQIRINALALSATLPDENFDEEAFERLRKRIPMQRLGEVEEITKSIDYLLDMPAITGQTLYLSGGMHL